MENDEEKMRKNLQMLKKKYAKEEKRLQRSIHRARVKRRRDKQLKELNQHYGQVSNTKEDTEDTGNYEGKLTSSKGRQENNGKSEEKSIKRKELNRELSRSIEKTDIALSNCYHSNREVKLTSTGKDESNTDKRHHGKTHHNDNIIKPLLQNQGDPSIASSEELQDNNLSARIFPIIKLPDDSSSSTLRLQKMASVLCNMMSQEDSGVNHKSTLSERAENNGQVNSCKDSIGKHLSLKRKSCVAKHTTEHQTVSYYCDLTKDENLSQSCAVNTCSNSKGSECNIMTRENMLTDDLNICDHKDSVRRKTVVTGAVTNDRTQRKTVVAGAVIDDRTWGKSAVAGAVTDDRPQRKTVVAGAVTDDRTQRKTVLAGAVTDDRTQRKTVLAGAVTDDRTQGIIQQELRSSLRKDDLECGTKTRKMPDGTLQYGSNQSIVSSTKSCNGQERKHKKVSYPLTKPMLHKSCDGQLKLLRSSNSPRKIQKISSYPRKTQRLSSRLPVMSSVFQFIIDECKHENREMEFKLPPKYFDKYIAHKLDSIKTDLHQKCIQKELCKHGELHTHPLTPSGTSSACQQSLKSKAEIDGKLKRKSAWKNRGKHKLSKSEPVSLKELHIHSVCKDIDNFISSPKSKKEFDGDLDARKQDSEKGVVCSPPLFSQLEECINNKDTTLQPMESSQNSYEEEYIENCKHFCTSEHKNSSTSIVTYENVFMEHDPDQTSVLADDIIAMTALDDGEDLLHMSSFKVQTEEHIQKMLSVTVYQGKKVVSLICCLSTRTLSLWLPEDFNVTCLQKWSFPSDLSGVDGDAMDRGKSVLCVVLLENDDKKCVCSAKFEEDKAHSITVLSQWNSHRKFRQILFCETAVECLVTSTDSLGNSHVTKYILGHDGKEISSSHDIGCVTGSIQSIHLIQGLTSGVIGHMESQVIHIWNHAIGTLLITVDISHTWPQQSLITSVCLEKGYLICSLFSKSKSKEPGCQLIINPTNQKSTVLYTFQCPAWPGCTTGCDLEDNIVAITKDGSLLSWNKFTGVLVSKAYNLNLTNICMTKYYVALARNTCVHIFKR